MMRDKKELEKVLRYFRHKAEYTVESDERKEMYAIAAEAVEKVLNPDFVEVVRCRECKHSRKPHSQEVERCLGVSVRICTVDNGAQPVWPNHFCSYGERREDG